MARVYTSSPTITFSFTDAQDLDTHTVTAGHALICWVATYGAGSGASGVSDPVNGTWTKLGGETGTTGEVSIWGVASSAGGSITPNVNPTGGGDLFCAGWCERDDVFSSFTVDQSGGNNTSSGTTLTATCGGNTAQASELALAAYGLYNGVDNTGQITYPSGWTTVIDQPDDSFEGLIGSERYLVSITTPSASWVQTTAGALAAVIVTLPLAGGGGTTFTQNVGGSITPAGAVAKQTRRLLTGGVTPSGIAVRRTIRTLAGAMTPSGLVVRRPQRTLTGTITPAGAVIRSTSRKITGTITPGGTVVKQTARKLTGGITPSGTVAAAHVVLKLLTGGVTPAGALIRRAQPLRTGFITPTGTVTRQTVRLLTGGVTPTGSVVRQMARRLVGAIVPAGALAALKLLTRLLTGSVTPSGSLTKTTNRPITGSMTPGGALTRQTARKLTGSVTPSSTLATVKASLVSLAGSITPAGSLRRLMQRPLSGSITPAGAASRQMSRAIGGAVTPSGSLARQTQRVLTGAVSASGMLRRQVQRLVAGIIGLSGIVTHSGTGSGTPPHLPADRRTEDPAGGQTRFSSDEDNRFAGE